MSKKEMVTQGEIPQVVFSESDDTIISNIVRQQPDGFPSIEEVSGTELFRDVFANPPSWFNSLDYTHGWVTKDDADIEAAIEDGHWRLVTRSNHPKAPSSDFRSHGGYERRGMLLVYRPKSITEKILARRAADHMALLRVQTDKFEESHPIVAKVGGRDKKIGEFYRPEGVAGASETTVGTLSEPATEEFLED